MNNIDSVIKQIAAACGIEEKNVIVNDLYLQWVLQPSYEMIAVCGILILAIVLFSVVVIYNIFQVGIANKIPSVHIVPVASISARRFTSFNCDPFAEKSGGGLIWKHLWSVCRSRCLAVKGSKPPCRNRCNRNYVYRRHN